MWNLWQTVPFLKLSGPGCFAYPDMLTLGTPAWDPTCNQGRGCYPDAGCNGTRLGFAAAQAQFAAQAVISSPLTLGYDLANASEYARWWPIVSNAEALAINAAWAGEAGRLVAASPQQWTGPVPHGAWCEVIQVSSCLLLLALLCWPHAVPCDGRCTQCRPGWSWQRSSRDALLPPSPSTVA